MTSAGLQMTVAQARDLPPVISVSVAAAILGIGRSAAYDLIRSGEWPTSVLRLGNVIRIPTDPLLELIQVYR